MVGRGVVLEWRWGDARVALRWAGRGLCGGPREEWMGVDLEAEEGGDLSWNLLVTSAYV